MRRFIRSHKSYAKLRVCSETKDLANDTHSVCERIDDDQNRVDRNTGRGRGRGKGGTKVEFSPCRRLRRVSRVSRA